MIATRRQMLAAALALPTTVASSSWAAGRTAVHAAGGAALVLSVRLIAEAYMREFKDSIVTVAERDSVRGVMDVISGTEDIGLTIAEESLPTGDRAKEVSIYRLGWEAEAAIVNPDNPVKGLTMGELTKIYTGDFDNWSQVGGPDLPIAVLVNLPSSGAAESWQHRVIKGPEYLSRRARVVDMEQMRQLVRKEAGAIGHISRPFLTRKDKALDIDGVPPTTEALVAGRYKLLLDLLMVAKEKPEPNVLAFIKYCLDPEKGQKILAATGAKPLA